MEEGLGIKGLGLQCCAQLPGAWGVLKAKLPSGGAWHPAGVALL